MKRWGILLVAIVIGGCVTETAVVPLGHNVYDVSAPGIDKINATQRAENKATAICKMKHKKVIVLNEKTENTAKPAGLQSQKTSITQNLINTVDPNAYQVTMRIKCVSE